MGDSGGGGGWGASCLPASTRSQLSEKQAEIKAARGERVKGQKNKIKTKREKPSWIKPTCSLRELGGGVAGGACDGLKQPAVMIISGGTCWQAGVSAGLSCPRCCDGHHQVVTAVSRAARTTVFSLLSGRLATMRPWV